MRKNLFTKKISNLLLTMMLIVAMAFTVVGCGDKNQANDAQQTTATETESKVLGEGQTKIFFTVVDKDGNESSYEIHTDKETVGDALLEHELIAGDESEYGLYVKQVTGITADYNTDGTYWAFYVNGEYCNYGIDSQPVSDGETYTIAYTVMQ